MSKKNILRSVAKTGRDLALIVGTASLLACAKEKIDEPEREEVSISFHNVPPYFYGVNDFEVPLGFRILYSILAYSDDADPVVFSSTSLPEGAEITPSVLHFSDTLYRAYLDWTPYPSQLGVHEITLRVEDLNEQGNKKIGSYDEKTVEALVKYLD